MKNLCVLNIYSCVGEGRNPNEKYCCEHIGFLSRKISSKGSKVCGSQYLFHFFSQNCEYILALELYYRISH